MTKKQLGYTTKFWTCSNCGNIRDREVGANKTIVNYCNLVTSGPDSVSEVGYCDFHDKGVKIGK